MLAWESSTQQRAWKSPASSSPAWLVDGNSSSTVAAPADNGQEMPAARLQLITLSARQQQSLHCQHGEGEGTRLWKSVVLRQENPRRSAALARFGGESGALSRRSGVQETPGPRGRAAGDRGCGARRVRAETRARRAGALQTAQGAAGGRVAAGTGGDLRPNTGGPDPPAAGARGRAEMARRGGAVGTGTSGTPRSGCQLKGWTRPRRRRTRQRPPPSGPPRAEGRHARRRQPRPSAPAGQRAPGAGHLRAGTRAPSRAAPPARGRAAGWGGRRPEPRPGWRSWGASAGSWGRGAVGADRMGGGSQEGRGMPGLTERLPHAAPRRRRRRRRRRSGPAGDQCDPPRSLPPRPSMPGAAGRPAHPGRPAHRPRPPLAPPPAPPCPPGGLRALVSGRRAQAPSRPAEGTAVGCGRAPAGASIGAQTGASSRRHTQVPRKERQVADGLHFVEEGAVIQQKHTFRSGALVPKLLCSADPKQTRGAESGDRRSRAELILSPGSAASGPAHRPGATELDATPHRAAKRLRRGPWTPSGQEKGGLLVELRKGRSSLKPGKQPAPSLLGAEADFCPRRGSETRAAQVPGLEPSSKAGGTPTGRGS
nr:collagen alpha-1(I) chain-like [Delphinus delphis]